MGNTAIAGAQAPDGGEITAAEIMQRLRSEAQGLGRPEQRHATLDRLEEACNDLASGKAAEYLRQTSAIDQSLAPAYGAHYKRGPVVIKPPRIEEYVKARRAIDQNNGLNSAWTGPISATLRGEPDGMLAYVRRREAEQTHIAKRPKHSSVEDDIDQIPDLDARQRLRFALDDAREAKRQLHLLKTGLLKIPEIDVHALLGQKPQASLLPSPAHAPERSPVLDDAALRSLRSLLDRLDDKAFLASFDLENDGNRVKNRATKATLIEKAELTVLRGLAPSPKAVDQTVSAGGEDR